MNNHAFNVNIACKIGVEKATILNNIIYWREKDKANGTNNHDGRYWVYNSAEAFAKLFPYLKKGSISRRLGELVKDGYLHSGCYNKSSYDKTMWYSPTDKTLSIYYMPPEGAEVPISQNETSMSQNGVSTSQNETTIPIIITDEITDSFSDREEDLNTPLTGEQDSPQPVSETTIPGKSITLEQFIERRNAIDTLKQNNITVRGFKKCRSPNDDIRAEWNKIRKKYLDVDIITACDNYITDIETRKPKADSDYHEHRFSLYAFLTQKNGFIKFANL